MNNKKPRDIVHVRVIRHMLQGLSVALDNGDQGIIRAREISWDGKDGINWKEEYPVGWEGYAVAIPLEKGEAREFSLRLVEYDPWDDFFEGLGRNQVIDGTVTGVYEYGIFVELDAGITGLLHKSRIPAKLQPSILDLFWHNDKVYVTIHDVDHEKRHIELSLAPVENFSGESMPGLLNQSSVTHEAAASAEQVLKAGIQRRHILVVEDEVPQSETVCAWLREMSQHVDVVQSAEEALDYLSKVQPDIALIDVGLPGMSGIELANNILDHYPQVQVVNATDWARASEVRSELDALQDRGGKLFYKPLVREELASYLADSNEETGNVIVNEEPTPRPPSQKWEAKKAIHKLLVMCRKHLGVEQVFLFSFDPAHRKVSIIERAGDGLVNKSAIAQLLHSPVRDVAEDGEAIFVNEIGKKDQKRFQHLLEFSPETVSCIGVQVPAQSSLKYALFAMDKRAKQFGEAIQIYAEGMSLAIGATLDQLDLRERAALMQRSALIGNLASGMIHEINNLLAPLQYESDNLRKALAQIEKDPEHARYENVRNEVANIEQDIRQIVGTVGTFGKIAKKPQLEVLRVDEIIKDTLVLLKQISKRARVDMYFQPPEKLVVVRNKAVMLGQILLNVCLNAIQQIAEHGYDHARTIRIDMEPIRENSNGAMCRILIRDNGPGIHASLWDKIFEMGYSTRQDGSGIGLFVSRNLMEEVEGNVYVLDSHILFGTVFALEFPVHV
ncbi:MAG: S1 RNA-binding domain-containing protein [Chloroflexi bacterium]|nr:S1 RNA-binding domain-containing protein [Chloroflexota bacterium]